MKPRKKKKPPAPPPRRDEFTDDLDYFDAVSAYLLDRGEIDLALFLFPMSTQDIEATIDNYSKAGIS